MHVGSKRKPEDASLDNEISGGRQQSVVDTPATSTVVTAASFAAAASAVSQSGRSTIHFAAALAKTSDAVVVSPGLKDLITRRNKLFRPFMLYQQLGTAVGSNVVFVADVKGACSVLCEESKVVCDVVTLIRGNIDAGGGIIKMSFAFITDAAG